MSKFIVTYASSQLREAVRQYISEHLLSENAFVNLAIHEKVGRGADLDQLIEIATRVVTNAQPPYHEPVKPGPTTHDDDSSPRPKIMLRFSTLELRDAAVEAAENDFKSINKFINIAIEDKLARAKALESLIELAGAKLLSSRG